MSWWKIFDNLRRSLVPPCLVLLLAVAWFVLPAPAWPWTLAALAVLAMPFFTQLVSTFGRRPVEMPWRQYFVEVKGNLGLSALQRFARSRFFRTRRI